MHSRVRATAVLTVALWAGLVPSAAIVDVSFTDGVGMPHADVEISITTDKTEYAPGEPIMMCLEVTNQTEEVVTFKFSSGQRYDFLIEDAAGHTVWRWATDKGFIQMLGEQRVAPGQVLTYRERFDGILPSRTYTVVGILVASNRPLRASTTITVR